MREDVDQVLFRQPLQRLAHRRAGNIEPRADVLLSNGGARRHIQSDNGVPKLLIYLIGLAEVSIHRYSNGLTWPDRSVPSNSYISGPDKRKAQA